jgi:5S rRNA maturation endonuclease (ribonuclease M5)
MPDNDKMQRVSRKSPCPVCNKPDWCLVAEDGSATICQRIEAGSVKRCGDAGWLHIFRENVHNIYKTSVNKRQIVKSVCTDNDPTKDFEPIVMQCQRQLSQQRLNLLAVSLGVSVNSLKRLKTGWDGEAYTFSMSNAEGMTIGIRRRFPNGCKCSVTGSRTGLFIPSKLSVNGLLLIVEGPTDTAAALDLGFDAIGRPNCNSKIEMTAKAARGREEIVIIGDNDSAGKNGAEKLAEALVIYYPSVKIIYPPDSIKDLRQWLQADLNAVSLQEIIKETKPIEIQVIARRLKDNERY